MDQKPKVVQVYLITTHSTAKSVEMDPIPCSFWGMYPYKVEHIEDHSRVERRVDN